MSLQRLEATDADGYDRDRECSYNAMPLRSTPHAHRSKNSVPLYNNMVHRPIAKAELLETPQTQEAMESEFKRLVKKGTFDMRSVKDWNEVAKEARSKKKTVHVGRVFGICTEKNSELPKDKRTWRGRYTFQGNNARDQNAEVAVFDSLSSTPATMEGSRAVDAYGLVGDQTPNSRIFNHSLKEMKLGSCFQRNIRICTFHSGGD